MSESRTYINIYADNGGRELPIPPLDDLRVYRDGVDTGLSVERYDAAEDWWLNANHPGFGLDLEHTATCMRQAGFSEVEISDELAELGR